MSLMTWTADMSVGVKSLDDDHKKLIGMLNDLHDGILAGHAKDGLGPVLNQLIQYTKIHFSREEGLFAQTGYAGATAHKQEHADLVKKALDIQGRFKESPSSMLSLETMSFLKNWLSRHILDSDKKYKAHLNSKGIR